MPICLNLIKRIESRFTGTGTAYQFIRNLIKRIERFPARILRNSKIRNENLIKRIESTNKYIRMAPVKLQPESHKEN